jgi:ABC-type uncharacterized transport system permease subunit
VREFFITRHLSEKSGHIISTVTLCALILLVVCLAIGWMDPRNQWQAFLIGVTWAALTLAFEFLVGHYVFGTSCEKLLADYNVLRGRIWPLVPLTCLVAPMFAHWL